MKVTVATRPFFARLFVGAPANLNVKGVDLSGYKGAGGLFRLVRIMAGIGADAVADLHDVPRTRAICAWLRLRGVRIARVDKRRRERKRALRGKIRQQNFVDRYADTFRRLGFNMTVDESSLPHAWPAPPFEPSAYAVGIAPFARYATKTCPPDGIREACRILASKGYDIYLFGGRGAEAATLAEWERDSERIRSIAGKYTLEEEISLMERMMVMVSMDSANQHLASLAGTRVLDSLGRHHTRMRLHAIRAAGGGFILQRHQLPAMFGGRHEKLSRRSSLFRSLFPIQTQSHPSLSGE